MLFTFNKQKNEDILIVGCSRFGSNLAAMLSEQNKNVTLIDLNRDAFCKLPPSYAGFTIEGDGTDLDLLAGAGARQADILVAATNDDDTNIMIAQMAKQYFEIENVVARVQDSTKQVAYEGMGIQSICPAVLSANEFNRIFYAEAKAV